MSKFQPGDIVKFGIRDYYNENNSFYDRIILGSVITFDHLCNVIGNNDYIHCYLKWDNDLCFKSQLCKLENKNVFNTNESLIVKTNIYSKSFNPNLEIAPILCIDENKCIVQELNKFRLTPLPQAFYGSTYYGQFHIVEKTYLTKGQVPKKVLIEFYNDDSRYYFRHEF